MIEVTLNIGSDGQVRLADFAWKAVREDGFGIVAAGSVEADLGAVLYLTNEEVLNASGPPQVRPVINYLFENFSMVSWRVIVFRDSIEFRRIEYTVPKPELKLPPPTRVSRYSREPVI